MNDLLHSDTRTALVLGGGGSAGNAWLIGVIAGLFEAGVDVTRADLIVGTSAGSTAAAQVTGASPPALLADILKAPSQPPARSAPMGPGKPHLDTTAEIIDAATDASDMRRKMGSWAVEMAEESGRSGQERWRGMVGARFASHEWPRMRLLITAVDADTGEPAVFDSDSGVDLVDAVAASTAGGFAYGIDDRRYVDGGYRTNADNADLAEGYRRVLVLSPFGGRTRLPLEWGLDLETQVSELRAKGSAVETIFPDENALCAFGDNMMDLSRRAPAARAGYEQGRARAGGVMAFWSR